MDDTLETAIVCCFSLCMDEKVETAMDKLKKNKETRGTHGEMKRVDAQYKE